MTDFRNLTDASKSTVVIQSTGGRGVIVPGGYVITATHCLGRWQGDGSLALGEPLLEHVKFTGLSQTVTLAGIFADPFSDLAVLGVPDNQQFPSEAALAEETFADHTSIPISMLKMNEGEEVEIGIRDHDGDWVQGTAVKFGRTHGDVWAEAAGPILFGASGGPIITRKGELLAVVSSFSTEQPSNGRQPHIQQSLPPWLLSMICRGD